MRAPIKVTLVVVGATILSTLAINATDSIRGISNSLVGLAIESGQESICPEHMSIVSARGTSICVDTFEASPGSSCTFSSPRNIAETNDNLSADSCVAVSEPAAEPWRFIALNQAQQACAKAGKRLPTNEEWYRAALGAPLEGCHTDGGGAPHRTDEGTCISSSGIYNAVGNVWEWVDESVQDGNYNNRQLPQTGYVAEVDPDGVAIASTPEENPLYGGDYFWSNSSGIRGMIRGGFYGSGEDAGIYAMNSEIEFSFSSPGIGFRCVKDI